MAAVRLPAIAFAAPARSARGAFGHDRRRVDIRGSIPILLRLAEQRVALMHIEPVVVLVPVVAARRRVVAVRECRTGVALLSRRPQQT